MAAGPEAQERVRDVLLHLSARVAAIAQIDEAELLVELRHGQFLVFAKSPEPGAHCLWAFGGPLDKWQNSQLHKTIAAVLEKHLQIAPARVRITRVQLYEILDLNSQLEAASRPATPAVSGSSGASGGSEKALSPRERALSPRSPQAKKEKKERKGWSKSLEKKKAGELTAAKERKASEGGGGVAAAEESDSSERSGKLLLEKDLA